MGVKTPEVMVYHRVACPACFGRGMLYTPQTGGYSKTKKCTLCKGSKIMELEERCFIRSIVETERYCRKALRSLRQRRMKGKPFVPYNSDELKLMRGAFCGTCHYSRYPELMRKGDECKATGRGLKSQKGLCLWVYRGDGEPTCIAYRRSDEYDWDEDFATSYCRQTKNGNLINETRKKK